jgi:hypothetical protein
MNPPCGSIIIQAVIKANAIRAAEENPDGSATIYWSACGAEQIEAALEELGYDLVQKPHEQQ